MAKRRLLTGVLLGVTFYYSLTTVLLNVSPDSSGRKNVRYMYHNELDISGSKLPGFPRHDATNKRLTLDCDSMNKVKHFVFVKIGKTGSSSLYSMFARFALKYRLNMIIPGQAYFHIDWWKPGNGDGWYMGPHTADPVDAVINHHKFNETIYNSYMHPDTKYIIPLRHPVSWFKSAVRYYGPMVESFKGLKTAEQVVQDTEMFTVSRNSPMHIESWFHLVQLQWLGFDVRNAHNISKIKTFILNVIPKFCWDHLDIAYSREIVTNAGRADSLSEGSIKLLLSESRNLGDLMLYQAANDTWWTQPELQQPDFWDEVRHFRELNSKLHEFCSKSAQIDQRLIAASRWHNQITLSRNYCVQLKKSKGTWLGQTKQYVLNTHPT